MGTSWVYGERDYRAIEKALMRSDYGRWFLEEYLVRNRSEETQRLLDALARLESSLETKAAADQLPRLHEIAAEIDAALDETLRRMDRDPGAHATTTEPPSEAILEAVEDINGFLESLNVRHVHNRLPEKIRRRLGDIQQACALVEADSGTGHTLGAVLNDLRRRLSAVSGELMAADLAMAVSRSGAVRFRRQLFDELAEAFADFGQAPAN